MTRTRTLSDDKILQATMTLVCKYGVGKLTFAALGAHIGLAPSTLVQRFGTKRQLLIATTKHCLRGMVLTLDEARHKNLSPLQAVYAAFGSMSKAVIGVEEFANGQVFFYLALADQDTYSMLRASMEQTRKRIQQLLDEAVVRHELRPCNTAALALTLQTTYEGAITTWLAYQEGGVETWVRSRLSAIIEPYKTIS